MVEETKAAQWYWKKTKGEYMPYTNEINSIIESAYKTKLYNLNLDIKGVKYLLDLEKMEQKNLKSGTIRVIRRVVEGISTNSHKWYFLDDPLKSEEGFVSYSEQDSEILERAYLSKCSSWILTVKSKKYEIDFDKMIQTNLKTRYKRKIKRMMKTEKETFLCQICMENPQQVIFIPCGHLGCCKNCSKKIKESCPFCDTLFTSICNVYQP